MLNEQALLAAQADDYMNDHQLAYFRSRLVTERDALLQEMESCKDCLQSQEVEADENDRASQEEERWLKLQLRDRNSRTLKEVNAALRRISDGDYGYCEETGEEIGLARLLIRPTATLSIEAKERREQRDRHFREELAY